MEQNTGSFDACQDVNGILTERVPGDVCGGATGLPVEETCGICHGEGRSADTADAHGLNL